MICDKDCLNCKYDDCIFDDEERKKRNAYQLEMYYKHREKKLAYAKEYREKNKESQRKYHKRYYQLNRDELLRKARERNKK